MDVEMDSRIPEDVITLKTFTHKYVALTPELKQAVIDYLAIVESRENLTFAFSHREKGS